MTTRLTIALSLTAGLLTACQQDVTAPAQSVGGPAFAATAGGVETNQIIPIDLVVTIPCANDGLGEDVELTGNLHDMFNVTLDNTGGAHVKYHDQPQGVSGIGSVTGDKYQGTGVTQEEFNITVGEQDTFVDNFRIIGQSSGNNYLSHEDMHFTVNPDGTTTVYHDNFRVECK